MLFQIGIICSEQKKTHTVVMPVYGKASCVTGRQAGRRTYRQQSGGQMLGIFFDFLRRKPLAS